MAFDFVYCPFEELPADADPTAERPSKYSFGSDVFGHSEHWIIAENDTDPVKVYKVPMPATRIMKMIFDDRFAQGQSDAQQAIRRALGL
jgi:hypothetical protein